MSVCALCGSLAPAGLCNGHVFIYDDDWSAANRIVCDLLHRSVVPARLPVEEREPLEKD